MVGFASLALQSATITCIMVLYVPLAVCKGPPQLAFCSPWYQSVPTNWVGPIVYLQKESYLGDSMLHNLCDRRNEGEKAHG